MLVHFIGGPAHGRTEALQNPHDTYRVAELKSRDWLLPQSEAAGIFAEVPFEEHEYRITRRTSRYCIAEWQPPKVTVQVAVEFTGLTFWDRTLHDKLMKLIEEEERGDTLAQALRMQRHHYGTGALALEWSVVVDGPADATAISEATALVQQRIDNALGAEGRHVIQQVSAAVRD